MIVFKDCAGCLKADVCKFKEEYLLFKDEIEKLLPNLLENVGIEVSCRSCSVRTSWNPLPEQRDLGSPLYLDKYSIEIGCKDAETCK